MGGPEKEGDEEQLHGGAEPERGDGLAAEGCAGEGGVDVGREHGDEEREEAVCGEPVDVMRQHEADGARQLERAG